MKAQFEKISTENNALNAFIYEDEYFDAPWHFHPEYELTYILKGKGMRYVGNSIQKFEEGDFVLLGGNLPHCWKDTNNNNTSVKSIVFQWNDAILGDKWLDKNEFYNIKKLLNSASQGVNFDKKTAKKYKNTLLEIIVKNGIDKLFSFINLLDSLSKTNNNQLLTSVNFSANLNLKTNYRIDKVQEFLFKNYNKKIRLDDVSNLVSMSNEAFCRFFKKNLHKSFFTFVNEYRITLATKMLIETNKQISQIAYDCGYESLPFFYKQFQKFMNCSPKKFKTMHSGIN